MLDEYKLKLIKKSMYLVGATVGLFTNFMIKWIEVIIWNYCVSPELNQKLFGAAKLGPIKGFLFLLLIECILFPEIIYRIFTNLITKQGKSVV